MKDLKEYVKLKDQLNDIRKSKDDENSMESNTNEQSNQNAWEIRNRKRNKNVQHSKNKENEDTSSTDKKKDSESNCTECDFQSTTEYYLKKHIDLKHSIKNKNTDETIQCRNCGDVFKDKWSLMNHRKLKHSNTVAYCRNNIEGRCNFSADICCWNHNKGETNSERGVECFICIEKFKSKTDLMIHRKANHPKVVRVCNLH